MRFAFNGDIEVKKHLEFDVVIVGAGLAGLYTALHIDKKYSCCILTKEGLDISNSWLAQGGIAAAIAVDEGHPDSRRRPLRQKGCRGAGRRGPDGH